MTVGFQRSVVIEELREGRVRRHAHDVEGRRRPRQGALEGDRDRAAERHPLRRQRPAVQLCIHLTAWHSILYAYERYGPGKLSAEDEASYWADCAVAAELQTCDPADVPGSREGIRDYFEYMRPRLAGSGAAQSMMDFLLDGEVMFPPTPRVLRPMMWTCSRTPTGTASSRSSV
jgi:hypothetical protein